jgi:4-hydroxybenzoate polyprenyltransferase
MIARPKLSLPAWVQLLRPRQWPKNLVLLAALIFTGRFTDGPSVLLALLALLAFLLLSSAVYSLNDVLDAEADRQHPEKKLRPVASGAVSPMLAWMLCVLLALLGLALSAGLGRGFLALAVAYLALQLLYSLWGKQQVILDVFLLAAGFVLRAAAGGAALKVQVSAWLLLCATLLALFLGLAKRRQEMALLKDGAGGHRAALQEYSVELLDQMITITASGAVVSYALFTFNAHTLDGQPVLMLTLPFVLFGVFRYLYLLHRRGLGGRPEEVLLTDHALLLDLGLWALACGLILYRTH